MTTQINVGQVSIYKDTVRWIILNFYGLQQEYDTVIRSPQFRFADRSWHIQVYPNGRRMYSSSGWFGISVANLNSDSTLPIVRLGIVEKPARSSERNLMIARAVSSGNGFYSCIKFIPASFLQSKENCMVQEGNLHILFDIQKEAICCTENKLLLGIATEDVDKCFKVKSENGGKEASTQTEKETGLGKLNQDLKEILLNNNFSDIVLNVEGQEFRAHRCILAARSPVFLAMMTHETKEKISGIVDIPDIDPNTFRDFLNYLYTENVDNLTSGNAFKLCTTADKYQVNELKKYCLDSMTMNISAENFCDVFTLSLRHNENMLEKACIQFFAENSLKISLTSKWQSFLSENPMICNELFVKHLQLTNRL